MSLFTFCGKCPSLPCDMFIYGHNLYGHLLSDTTICTIKSHICVLMNHFLFTPMIALSPPHICSPPAMMRRRATAGIFCRGNSGIAVMLCTRIGWMTGRIDGPQRQLVFGKKKIKYAYTLFLKAGSGPREREREIHRREQFYNFTFVSANFH